MKAKLLSFSCIGILNTALDFLIVNILFGIHKPDNSIVLLLYVSVAFMVSNINSYYMNKKLTFKVSGSYGKFLMYSMATFLLNGGIICGLSLILPNNIMALNLIKLVATGVCFTVNFFVYNSKVFRSDINERSYKSC